MLVILDLAQQVFHVESIIIVTVICAIISISVIVLTIVFLIRQLKGTPKNQREAAAKLSQKTSSHTMSKYNSQKATNSRPYYFQDSDMQLLQANESLDDEDSDKFSNKETRLSLPNVSKKASPRPIYNNDGSSLVEIYTPRSIKCYNISKENSNDGQENANMLLEMKFAPKSNTDCARLPISLTCDDRIKNPVARTVLNSFSLLQSKYAK